MENVLEELLIDLEKLKNPARAKVLAGFFKTGPGEYGQGDIFWGIYVPQLRAVVKKYFLQINFSGVKFLLQQKIHELRFVGAITLTEKYKKGNEKEKKSIAEFYLKNLKGINNWDLVDLSAPKILGDYFFSRDKKIIYRLARSKNLWERRVAMLTTFGFLQRNNFTDTLQIAEILLLDKEDLIHKAVGWMLREVGKRDRKILENFLQKNKKQMSRVTLRYAIEKFSSQEKKFWMKR